MGEHEVSQSATNRQFRAFMRAILDDVHALERMIEAGLIETGVRRIGAEQEIFLIDEACHPAPIAMEMLAKLNDRQFTTELARFNLETNLSPRKLAGRGLFAMEEELNELLQRVRDVARELGARAVITGILPTVQQSDLGIEAMTPLPRYATLNKAMADMRGGEFQAYIKGLDELHVRHDNVLFEACNTSFQVHFQVGPEEFARFYNLAQAITAPVLACSVNSPVALQHRLWHETRVALFQQSVDERSDTHVRRGSRPRVSFGDAWVRESVLEIFREDIARFKLVLTTDLPENSMQTLDRGEIPELTALRLHNGTVYRWNRACYGVADGKAHLRIENRALPAGPTVVDEIANAAFFFGLMSAVTEEHPDITKVLAFDDAKANFVQAARYGLKARLRWISGRESPAPDLLLNELIPRAREGLKQQKVEDGDIDRYLGIIEGRVRTGRTGAQWILDSLAAMPEGSRDERYRAVVATMAAVQWNGKPVHEWPLAQIDRATHWTNSYRTVDQVMTTDLFTVGPEDLVDLAASLMEWEHIRHVPVEDRSGKLVGLVTHRTLLRLLGQGMLSKGSHEPIAVRQIMKPDPMSVTPETPVLDAIALMRKMKVSCLPVCGPDGRLLGIVTERDFLDVAERLFEERLRETAG